MINYQTTRLLNIPTTQLLHYTTISPWCSSIIYIISDVTVRIVQKTHYLTTGLLDYLTNQLPDYPTNQLTHYPRNPL